MRDGFGEKAAQVKSASKSLVKLWVGREDVTSRHLAERRKMALGTARAYAHLIFEQINDEKLLIETDD